MDVEITWGDGPSLYPSIEVFDAIELDEVFVEPHLGRAYAHLDASTAAQATGAPPPSPEQVLTHPQRAALVGLGDAWPGVVQSVAERLPPHVRHRLEWSILTVTDHEEQGRAVSRLRGIVAGDVDDEHEYSEHGVDAWLVGTEVRWAGNGAALPITPGRCIDDTPPRDNPDYDTGSAHPSAEHALTLAIEDNWADLAAYVEGKQRLAFAAIQTVVRWAATMPEARVRRIVQSLRAAQDAANDPSLRNCFDITFYDQDVVDASMRVLVEEGVVELYPSLYRHETNEPWIRRLLAWGVDPAGIEVLASRSSAPSDRQEVGAPGVLLAALVQLDWVALEGGADPALVSGAVEMRFEQGVPTGDDLLAIPGVDDVFVTDEEIREFVERWRTATGRGTAD